MRYDTKLETSALLARCRAGDEAAWSELYQLFKPLVAHLAFRIFPNPHDAEDAMQDVFLHVHKTLGQFRGESPFSTWLWRVAYTRCLMKLRHGKFERAQTVDIETLAHQTGPRFTNKGKQPFGMNDPRYAATDARYDVEKALTQLPQGYRRALILHDLAGLYHKEIAKLGATVGCSKSQLLKARKAAAGILVGGAKVKVGKTGKRRVYSKEAV